MADERNCCLRSEFGTSHAGSHIGITIVRDVVAAHDWKLTVADAESGGSRLEIVTG